MTTSQDLEEPDPPPPEEPQGSLELRAEPQGLASEFVIPVNLIQQSRTKVRLNEGNGLFLMKICRVYF